MTQTIAESALLYRLECPLRSNTSSSLPESPVLTCAEDTARWLISEIADGRLPSSGDTREFFDSRWKQTTYFQSRDAIPPKQYQRRVFQGLRACRRLRDVLCASTIFQPVSPYQLEIGGLMIAGEYAVLQRSKRKTHGYILYLRDGGVKLRPLVPDVASFARFDHLHSRLPADWGLTSFGVLHYWVTRDLSALHTPAPNFAHNVLLGAAASVTAHPFPIPGKHCLACPTYACAKPKRDPPRCKIPRPAAGRSAG